MDEDFINEVKSIGLLLLSKLKENDYSIVEGNELQTEEDLNTDGVGFKRQQKLQSPSSHKQL